MSPGEPPSKPVVLKNRGTTGLLGYSTGLLVGDSKFENALPSEGHISAVAQLKLNPSGVGKVLKRAF